jgi:hypothetical protein
MNEYIVVFRAFARDASRCHVIVAHDDQGQKAALVGELDDNPGTSVTNALQQVADVIRLNLLDGDSEFQLYEYDPEGLPDLEPTFYRIEWNGEPGPGSMPAQDVVDPQTDPWLRRLRDRVPSDNYTSRALIAERGLDVIDARDRDDLPSAI